MKIWLVVIFSVWSSWNISDVKVSSLANGITSLCLAKLRFSDEECYVTSKIYSKENKGDERGCFIHANWGLYHVGQSLTIYCTSSQSTWQLGDTTVANCFQCQNPNCYTEDGFQDRVFATCDYIQQSSSITIKNLKTSDTSSLRCGHHRSFFAIFVGVYSKHFRSENNPSFALDEEQYTLVCDRTNSREMAWYDDEERYIGYFNPGRCQNIVQPSNSFSRIKFSCTQNAMRLHINRIRLDSDDKKTIACRNGNKLYFFDINVNVPVRTVTIKDSGKNLLLEGQRRNFICDSGKTKPDAIIWWFLKYQNGSKIRILDSIKNVIKKDQKKFQTISTLELDLKREYGGIMCQAKINDTAWTKSSNLELKIIYPPSKISISQTSSFEGETTTLTCNAFDGNAVVKRVLWLPGNISKQSIQLKLNRADNKKMYKCFMYFEYFNTLSASINLNVKYKPDIKTKEIEVIENRTQTITCEAEGNPNPEVQWIIGNNTFDSSDLNISFTRHVKNVVCVATANSPKCGLLKTIQRIHISVKYPPSKISISQTSSFEGETTTLTCNAFDGNTAVKSVLWLPGNFSKQSIQLTLNRTDNKKMFKCFMYFEYFNTSSASINLNVEYKPDIKTKEIEVIENRTQTIICEVEGNPDPEVQWIIGNNTFDSSDLNISFTRHIRNVICVATANSSKYGLLESIQRIHISVKYPPEITMISKATSLHERASIRCKYDAFPSASVVKIVQKWGNKVKREICSDFVEFQNISLKEFGTWVCRVSNNVPSINSYTESSVDLQVPVKPLIKGRSAEMAMFGSSKSLKLCFYSYPIATNVQWFKEGNLISSPRQAFEPAEDGLLPFLGNCSVLQVNTSEEQVVHNFSLLITNDVGQSSLPIVLLIDQPYHIDPVIYHTVIIILGAIIFYLMIAVMVYVARRKRRKRVSITELSKTDSMNLTTLQ